MLQRQVARTRHHQDGEEAEDAVEADEAAEAADTAVEALEEAALPQEAQRQPSKATQTA